VRWRQSGFGKLSVLLPMGDVAVTEKLFEAALGVSSPWFVTGVEFSAAARTLSINIDFVAGSRFALPGVAGEHPVHDTVSKRYRHLNFFQHECFLEVRVPRVKLPDGSVRQVEPGWVGKLSGFTLLFEALVLALCQQMTFRAAIFVTEGRGAETIAELAEDLRAHGGDPAAIESVSIDMSPAFIKGVEAELPNARITFDKFHVVAHASFALDQTRRREQKSDPELKGLRWALLKDRARLDAEQRADLDTLVAQFTTKRTARAWLYREQLRAILERRQVNVVRTMLGQWCSNVMRSKVEPMKAVAQMIRNHLEGIVAWAQTRQTNGFLEALNGLFQAAKRKARGYHRLATIRTVLFLLAGKLDFSRLNPHVA
jgi:transposase